MNKQTITILAVVIALIIVIGAAFTRLIWENRSLRKANISLQNRLAELPSQPIVINGDTLGQQKYVEVVTKLTTELSELKKVVAEQGLKLQMSTALQGEILVSLDSIHTAEGPVEGTQQFDTTFYAGGVRLAGNFGVKPPYLLNFQELRVALSANIAVSKGPDNVYITTVTDLPEYATLRILSTQIDQSVYQHPQYRQPKWSLNFGPALVRYDNHTQIGSLTSLQYYRLGLWVQALSHGWGTGFTWQIKF